MHPQLIAGGVPRPEARKLRVAVGNEPCARSAVWLLDGEHQECERVKGEGAQNAVLASFHVQRQVVDDAR